MRSTNNAEFITDGDTFIGINLGADFTAEHEWGIKELKGKLGIDGSKMGIERRTVTHITEPDLSINLKGKYGILLYDNNVSYYHDKPEIMTDMVKRWLPTYKHRDGQEAVTGSWDEGSFGIRVTGAENKERLKELHKALFNKDAVVMLGKFGNNPFENSGLMILIKSRLPKEFSDRLMEADTDAKKLADADKATGIKKKLEKAGKRWMALSPRWISDQSKSKHPVMYWLNPFDQRNNQYGWYTVEDLELWAQDKGPIIENSDAKKERRA